MMVALDQKHVRKELCGLGEVQLRDHVKASRAEPVSQAWQSTTCTTCILQQRQGVSWLFLFGDMTSTDLQYTNTHFSKTKVSAHTHDKKIHTHAMYIAFEETGSAHVERFTM